MARRYEFYVLVARTISHSFANILYFFFYALLNIRMIVGLIHVPAYAKLVILETETPALQRFVKAIEQLLQCDFKF